MTSSRGGAWVPTPSYAITFHERRPIAESAEVGAAAMI
jgi:hypothetical protein